MRSRGSVFLFVWLLAFAGFAVAQISMVPIPSGPGKCGVDALSGDASEVRDFGPKRRESEPLRWVSLPDDFCSKHATAGWGDTMKLRLGQGASKYRKLIERAVNRWNEAVGVRGSGQKPLIEIIDSRPTNFWLSKSFWENSPYEDPSWRDEENVIYFQAATNDEAPRGTALWFIGAADTVEADIYINTALEEEYKGRTLVRTRKIRDFNASRGFYAFINSTYEVILHEIGHALGLKHISTAGNAMSRDFPAGVVNQWSAAMYVYDLITSGEFGPSFASQDFHIFSHSQIFPYMALSGELPLTLTAFYTKNAKLGEQEKAALACMYEY